MLIMSGTSLSPLKMSPISICGLAVTQSPRNPDDQQFVESVDFSQRNLTSAKGDVIGMDSWGQLSSGLNWRHTAAFGSGAVYKNADKKSAALFDQIINSICTIDYPQK
jgi:hypothetical protein